MDLIANPQYYINEYKDNFKNGLRVECGMTPFLMRINQKDYGFLMKCLNCSISHDDGVDNILYDMPNQQPQATESNTELTPPQQKEPFFLVLTIDMLSLLIMKKGVPLAFLVLDDLRYSFEMKDSMSMDL